MTSFLELKVSFCVFLKNNNTDLRRFFFQGLGENSCSLQPALKSNAIRIKKKKTTHQR